VAVASRHAGDGEGTRVTDDPKDNLDDLDELDDIDDATSVTVDIGAEQAGQRLDQALAAVAPGLSRSQVQRLIKEGRVTSGGRVCERASGTVADGETYVLDIPPPAPSAHVAQDLPLEILYEDEDLVVVNKPPGMVVHPAAGHADGTLVNALLHHVDDLSGVGGEARPGIVHRLDKGTSGVMVVAKNDAAHQELARQFHDREIEKEYITLVWGVVNAGRRIEDPIGRDPDNRQRMSTKARRARTAVTRIVRVEHLPGVTLAIVGIATGRTHQIRVHLSAIGHPVVGDAVYGGVHRRVAPHLKAIGRLERPFLHALRLSFVHPRDKRTMEFVAPVSDDLKAIVEELRDARERFGL
jgi:23S rRNA pseudouridine1911/1915/1917 synthase